MKELTWISILSALAATIIHTVSGAAAEPAKSSQVVYGAGAQKSFKGPEAWFTGDIQVRMVFPDNESAPYSGAYVTFQPGARTAWHLHPAGQHMIVTSGVGLTGTRDGKIVRFEAGDAIWCPPGIDHWHGATPDSPMTHLVITGVLDGQNVTWKEKVTDEQYRGEQGTKGST